VKYTIYILVFTISSVFITNTAFAQQGGVSINSISTPADSSAMLDVASTSKGMLVPRMDSAQRVAISGPAIGLLVYQTDGVTPGFYNYNGSVWQKVGYSVQPHRVLYSTAGSFTFTTSATSTTNTVYTITLLGGGGGGGYTSGGGAGAYANFLIAGLAPNTVCNIIVGSGGTGSSPAGSPTFTGVAGGGTEININGYFVIAGGGQGGLSLSVGASGGTVTISGITGVLSYPGATSFFPFSGTGYGYGASTVYGSGGAIASVALGPGVANATGYGSGGGTSGFSIFGSGAGAPGLVIIEWSE
jgi:hypothetical protein